MAFSRKDISEIMMELNKMLGKRVLFADVDECLIAEEDEEYNKGIKDFLTRAENGPEYEVLFNGQGGMAAVHLDHCVIGALLVIGLKSHMKSQLLMAKRLMELMIEERLRKDQECADMLNRQELVKQWIFNEAVSDNDSFETRMTVAGIDLSGSHVVAVLRILTKEMTEPDSAILGRIRHMRSSYMGRLENLVEYVMVGDKLICLFRSEDDLYVQKSLKILKNIIESSYSVSVCGGIGQVKRNYMELHHSYEQADRACTISRKSRSTQIVRYDELSIDLLVDEISPQIKKDFVDKVFGNCKRSDVEEWKIILRAFFISNGSIGKVAEELFMHKNTLQYKLNKIREQTGYDPRSTCDALKLYLAILFSSNLRY